MDIFAKERTRTVELMPEGFTYEEALVEADYRANHGDHTPVEVDTERRFVEVTEPTVYGKLVNFIGSLAGQLHTPEGEE